MSVLVNANTAGTVVLNRNWAEGWVADHPFQAAPFRGQIAAHTGPGVRVIRFVYRPGVVLVGLSISLATLVGMAIGLVVSRKLDRDHRTR